MDKKTAANRAAKTTTNLSWMGLKIKFETLEELEAAVANGTIMKMIENCAEQLHGGDVKPAVLALRRNLSTKASNYHKALRQDGYISPENRDDAKRYQILWDFTSTLVDDIKTVTEMPEGIKATARWCLSREDIAALPRDYKTVDSIYQNMASKKAKKPEQIEESIGMTEFLERFKMVSALRSELKAGESAKAKADKDEMSKAILDKLNNSGRLSKKDIEALKELLK